MSIIGAIVRFVIERSARNDTYSTLLFRLELSALGTALSEPMLADEYDGYRPNTALSLAALREEFEQTRPMTVDLLRDLEEADVAIDHNVRHNDMGDVTVRGWFAYLAEQAKREAMRTKA